MHIVGLFLLSACASAFPSFFKSKPGNFDDFHDTFDPEVDPWKALTLQEIKDNPTKYEYRAPLDSDVRSPCPWLSMCANHGIIPRDGKNVHFESLFRCAHFGGHSKTLFKTTRATPVKVAKYYRERQEKRHEAKLRPLDRCDLHETGLPKPALGEFLTEHDLSLVRYDLDWNSYNLTKSVRPNKDLVLGLLNKAASKPGCTVTVNDQYLAMTQCEKEDDKCFLDANDLADWMAQRLVEENERHKTLGRPITYGINEEFAATGEGVFFLDLQGRNNRISLSHAKSFLWHEKLPIECGWEPPKELPFPVFLYRMVKMMRLYRSKMGKFSKIEFKDFKIDEHREFTQEEVDELMKDEHIKKAFPSVFEAVNQPLKKVGSQVLLDKYKEPKVLKKIASSDALKRADKPQ